MPATTPDGLGPNDQEPGGTVGEMNWVAKNGSIVSSTTVRAPRRRSSRGGADWDSGAAVASDEIRHPRLTLILGDYGCGKSALAHRLGGGDPDVMWGTIVPHAGKMVVSDHHPSELLAPARQREIASTSDSALARATPADARLILVRSHADHYAHLAVEPGVAVFLFRCTHVPVDELRILLGLRAQDAPHLLELVRSLPRGACLYREPSSQLSDYGRLGLLTVHSSPLVSATA